MRNSMKIGHTSSSSIGEAATGSQHGIAPPAPEVVLAAGIVESLEGLEFEAPTSGSTCSRASVGHMPNESITWLITVVYFYMVCLIGPLALFGIAGNALSVFILRRDRGARAMSLLLQALSVGNALLLAIAFFGRMIPDVYCYMNSPLLEAYFDYVYLFGLQYFSIGYDVVHMFIVYIILFIAVERNFAVLKPINRQTRGVFLVSRVRLYIAVVVLCSVAFHVPKVFEQQALNGFNANLTFPGNISDSQSDEHLHFLALSPSSNLNNVFYNAYRTLHVLVQQSIPIFVITYANLLLAKLLRDARRINGHLRDARIRHNHNGGSSIPKIAPTGGGLFERGSIVAFITVTCFLLGEVPMLVANLLELSSLVTNSTRGDHMAFLFHGVAIRVLDLVSCSNLVVYCLCGSRFRRTLRKTLCGRGSTSRNATRSRTPSHLVTTPASFRLACERSFSGHSSHSACSPQIAFPERRSDSPYLTAPSPMPSMRHLTM